MTFISLAFKSHKGKVKAPIIKEDIIGTGTRTGRMQEGEGKGMFGIAELNLDSHQTSFSRLPPGLSPSVLFLHHWIQAPTLSQHIT